MEISPGAKSLHGRQAKVTKNFCHSVGMPSSVNTVVVQECSHSYLPTLSVRGPGQLENHTGMTSSVSTVVVQDVTILAQAVLLWEVRDQFLVGRTRTSVVFVAFDQKAMPLGQYYAAHYEWKKMRGVRGCGGRGLHYVHTTFLLCGGGC